MKKTASDISIVIVAVLIFALNAVLGYILIEQSKNSMKILIDNRMLDISTTAADMLNGDELKKLRAEDKGSYEYQKINDTLAHFQRNIELQYIYCIQKVSDKEFAFSVDPTIEDPGEFGSPIVFTEALYKAGQGHSAVDDEAYTDAWGRFYSAYSPVFDSAGEVAGIVAVDFSAQWYDEQIAKQKNTIAGCMTISLLLCIGLVIMVTRQLRERVIEMTGELRTALKEAKIASKAKSNFLSKMSHEIRTPMNAIIGLNHIALENSDLPSITREQLKKINAAAKHLLSIINDILDMSRIESGKVVLKNEKFSFTEMLEQINVIIGSQCKDKGLNYDCKVIGEVGEFYIGDDLKLRQVLINILGNAVKFTDKGGKVRFQVEEISKSDDKSVLQFRISDNGVGISAEYLPKIFEAFSQENSGASNKYGSTGLGMAITKGFVEMMGGKISVESTKGIGTIFIVEIALTESKNISSENLSDDLPPVQKDLTGKIILLAEDMPVNAEIMIELLKMRGMEVDHAENGQIAVDKFISQPVGYYSAILMDMQMPILNGLDATEKIRNSNRADSKTIPIIALTANAFDEDEERSKKSGLNAHLSKPIDPEIIYKTLERLII